MTVPAAPPPTLAGPTLPVEPAAHIGIGAPPSDGAGLADWLGWAAERVALVYANDLTQYLIAAGTVFLVLWVLLRRRLAHRRIEPDYPAARHIRREVLYSLLTVVVFALNGLFMSYAVIAGWTRVYLDFATFGWGYWFVSIAALILLHDAYFYWTHRLMHHRRMFGLFHRLHHRSHNPSPWAAYAFAPPEAFVQGAFLPLIAFVLPMHPTAILVFVLHQIFRNALGHSGFEIFPARWQAHPLLRWINTTSHHHLHHSKGRGNYGLYFLWWDRLCGSEHPSSSETFARASAVRAEVAAAPQGSEKIAA
jgi:sterol desaturase/sphingolipid hydroxylase (fatty acid hydroxylase superfamily)